MALSKMHVFVPVLFLILMGMMTEATPPGIAKNPSNARCLIKKYKHCYNLVHVCPKFCPDQCTVECVSCKPICSGSSTTPSPPPPPTPTPSPSPPIYYPPPVHAPSPPPPTPSPPTPTPSPPTPTPSPPTPTPSPPTSTPSPPTTPSTPPPTTPSSPSPPTPSNPPPSPTPSPPIFSSPPPSTPTPIKTGKCKNKNYPQCYNIEHACPSSCPGGCEVDCVTCKPVCRCDQPGAVCQDPRFIGGDGITFYFHGKKNHNFCLLSDSNLHINAHFIGKRNANRKRDFTWVQSIAILYGKHQLFIGAQKTATWDDSVDRLALSFNGEPIALREAEGTKWQSESFPRVSFARVDNTNNVMVEVEGKFRITAKVVPITEEDSRVHNYGVTKDDALAHLDLGFKFFSLSDQVDGVLGQTYRPDYVSRIKIGVSMPVMGGDREFQTSGLFTADCSIARFNGAGGSENEGSAEPAEGLEFPSLNCASGIDGRGVVCKR
ncbi:hypothetical protein ACLB2K_012101 [Fragaria x ananassa]